MSVFKLCVNCHRRMYVVYESDSPDNKYLVCPYCNTRHDQPYKTMVEVKNKYKFLEAK